jgi:hypothetical protein
LLPFILGPEQIEALVALKAHAEAHPTPLEVLQALKDGMPTPEELNKDFAIDIPVGIRVVFTMEQQPIGLCKHMSMSVALEGRLPSPIAVMLVMEHLGFVVPLKSLIGLGLVWEEAPGRGVVAINVVEPVDGIEALVTKVMNGDIE